MGLPWNIVRAVIVAVIVVAFAAVSRGAAICMELLPRVIST